jgi:glycosyltransferase involved in cell wall biosynthesis
MKKVIHIINGLEQGGAETVLYKLLNGLCSTYEFSVISLMGEGYYSEKIENLGVKIYHLNMNYKNFLFVFFRLAKLIKNINPDLVQTWMPHANFIGGICAKIAGISKIIWSVRDSGINLKRSTYLILRASAIISSIIPTKIVYCADLAKKNYEKMGYNQKKGIVIYNGYDTNFFHPSSKEIVRLNFGIPLDKIIIGTLGRNHPDKDFLNFIKSAKIVSENNPYVFFVICGKNSHKLSSYIAENNLSPFFLLLPSTPQAVEYLNSLDIFVLPSQTEAFPNVVAEAMSCGIPCVVTEVGDAATIVKDTGISVPPQNSLLLAEGILNMLSKNLEEIRQLGKKARSRITENYNHDTMIGSYNRLYSEN